jgi:hypothetical protein
MAVLSTADVFRFSPDGEGIGKPVYLIAPATALQRAQYRRDLGCLGAFFTKDEDLFITLRDGVKKIIVAAEQGEMLTLVDRAEEAGCFGFNPQPLSDADRQQFDFLNEVLASHYPPFSQTLAARSFWMEVSPLAAAKRFLVGWENISHPFQRGPQGVDDACLALLPDHHVSAIGLQAMALMRPDRSAEKNFVSPSGSPDGPEISAAEPLPSTEADGTSMESVTTKIQP